MSTITFAEAWDILAPTMTWHQLDYAPIIRHGMQHIWLVGKRDDIMLRWEIYTDANGRLLQQREIAFELEVENCIVTLDVIAESEIGNPGHMHSIATAPQAVLQRLSEACVLAKLKKDGA